MFNKEKKKEYRRSKKGLVSQIYDNQKGHSKSRDHNIPTYTKQELIEWAFSQELFHTLYDNWKRLDFQKNYVPSVDRKCDYTGYTMDNIQLMTWEENKKKGELDKKKGTNNKNNKTVLMYSLEDVFIAEFYSASQALRDTNIRHISECCNGLKKQAGGFKWKFKKEIK